MAIQFQNRRGTVSENNNFTGAAGEVVVDTTNNRIRVHDGATVGGTVVGETYANILDYGAVSYGGDAKAAIQAALDANDTVIVPEGRFNISGTLYLNPDNRLIGAGGGYTSNSSKSWIGITADFTGDSMVEVKDTFDATGQRKVEIADLFLFAYYDSYVVDNVIKIKGYSSGRISNVTASNGRHYGIKLENYISGFSGNMTVENCYVRMPNDAYISDPITNPIYAAYYCEGLYNIFDNCLSDGGFNGMITDGGANGGFNTFSKCHPEGWLNAGIVLNDTNGKNKIIGCDIVATKVAADSEASNSYGIHISGTACYDNQISDNQIYNLDNTGPYLANSAGIYLSDNVQTVTGNKILNFIYGINIEGSFNILTSNSINNTTTGIKITSGGNNKISNLFASFNDSTGYLIDNTAAVTTNKAEGVSTSISHKYNNILPLDRPVYLLAYQSTAQNLPSVTETKILFQSEDVDVTDNYNTGTSTFTAPISGYYNVSTGVEFASAPTVATLTIRVQGSEKLRIGYTQNNSAINGSSVVYLQKGWSLNIYALCTGGLDTLAGSKNTYLNVALVAQSN